MCINNNINLDKKIIKFLKSKGRLFRNKNKNRNIGKLKRPTNFLTSKKNL